MLNPNLGFVEPAPPEGDQTSSPDQKSLHTSKTQQTGDENGGSPDRYRPARCGNPNPTGCLLNPNLGFFDPAPPGEDKMSPPDNKSFHTSTTANRRRKRRSPGSIPPRTAWKPQPEVHRLCATLEENTFPSPDRKCLHTYTTTTNRGRKRWPPGRYCLPRCDNPCLGFV